MINLNGIMSPNNHMDRAMGVIAVSAMVVSTGLGMYQANQTKQTAKGIAGEARTERLNQQAALDRQKEEYKAMKFENPFSNMENTFEDLTVNKQQAQFQAQQGNQQRANIMQSLRGAAGSSGIAGLAQAMANQGQLQTQRISASIGAQESRNQSLRAQGATNVQTAQRQGDQYVQQANIDRQSTLLGMQMGEATGANQAFQQAQANQMNAQMAQNQVLTDGISNVASTAVAAGAEGMFDKPEEKIPSDRRLKKNISKISESPSGLNIYSFEYKNSKYGKGVFQGVMSDEIPQEAVGVRNGYDTVDYSMLDVEFKQI